MGVLADLKVSELVSSSTAGGTPHIPSAGTLGVVRVVTALFAFVLVK
jgi:hypothetical protein